jgi:hypothetical protein
MGPETAVSGLSRGWTNATGEGDTYPPIRKPRDLHHETPLIGWRTPGSTFDKGDISDDSWELTQGAQYGL